MALKIRDAGTWKTLQAPHVKDSDTWKKCHLIYVKDGDTWKEAHRNTISQYSSDGGTTYSSGTSTYTVAQGVRFLRFLIKGGSGGGAGSMAMSYNFYVNQADGIRIDKFAKTGGTGGPGASIDVTMEVIPGEEYSLTVGGAGSAGGGNGIRARKAYSGNQASFSGDTSSTYYSSAGSVGGNSQVTGPRSINFRAGGGNGGGQASAYVAFYWYTSGDEFGYRANAYGSDGSTGGNQTGNLIATGTDASGATITDGTYTYNSTGGPSGGSGGSGYSGDISGSSGSSGTAGSIIMYKFT